jgi:hypothetical protein
MADFQPIKIVGIIEKDVSKPRNDGTPGSALYNVPFKLSSRPPSEWAEYFPNAWDHPSSYSSRHRPGICHVSGDVIWLNGTTLEEVGQTHKATLDLALDETNRKYEEFAAEKEAGEQRRRQQEEAHRRNVSETVKKIKFD